MAFNEKQKRFCKEYVISLNATDAAKKAGYSAKTAYSQGQRLLKNVEIGKYIHDLAQAAENRRVATVSEVLELFTEIMRDKDVAHKDRLKAAESLAKRYGLFNENKAEDNKLEIVITKQVTDLSKDKNDGNNKL